jgi:hypothetical protein
VEELVDPTFPTKADCLALSESSGLQLWRSPTITGMECLRAWGRYSIIPMSA